MTSDQNRFLHITYPRTASNLLLKVLALETHENVHMTPDGGGPQVGNGYFFMRNQMLKGKMCTHGKNMSEWTEEQKTRLQESTRKSQQTIILQLLASEPLNADDVIAESCFNDLEAYAQAASAQGKIAFVKEHIHFMTEPVAQEKFLFGENTTTQPPLTITLPPSYGVEGIRTPGNDTIFPDEFLRTWRPTLLIRHPALVFPSYYRACLDLPQFKSTDSQFDLFMTFPWQRRLHDWYLSQSASLNLANDKDVSWPIVLDADDIIADPAVVVRYCDIIGINAEKLKFEWAPVTADERAKIGNPAVERLLSCILASSGIQKDKVATNINIVAEAVKWKKEFGDIVGGKMEKWIENVMPEYEFMKARKLKAN